MKNKMEFRLKLSCPTVGTLVLVVFTYQLSSDGVFNQNICSVKMGGQFEFSLYVYEEDF